MKHSIRQLAACFLVLGLLLGLVACQDKGADKNLDPEKKTVTVTTTFLYDMVNVLVGDKVNLQLIIPAGEDPHLYKPLPADRQKIKNADLVLYHGLHFEGKMVEALEEYGVSVSENFPPEKVGAMDQDGQIIIDPHFWFDIELYKMACERAAMALEELFKTFKDAILALPAYEVFGPKDTRKQVPVLSLKARGKDGAELAAYLEGKGILTRVGLHCAPLAHQTLGSFPEGTVRFSLGYKTTKEELLETVEALKAFVRT